MGTKQEQKVKITAGGGLTEIEIEKILKEAEEYLDAQGYPVKTSVALMPGMKLQIVQADKELATAQIDPPELMAKTFIKADKALTTLKIEE